MQRLLLWRGNDRFRRSTVGNPGHVSEKQFIIILMVTAEFVALQALWLSHFKSDKCTVCPVHGSLCSYGTMMFTPLGCTVQYLLYEVHSSMPPQSDGQRSVL